jgi:hypothetical protein
MRLELTTFSLGRFCSIRLWHMRSERMCEIVTFPVRS